MTEPETRTFDLSDGYPAHVESWPAAGLRRGRVIVLHGVQSHAGWYPNLGRRLSEAGYEAHFPDRRGSGSNAKDRGHTPSARRLVDDVGDLLAALRGRDPVSPIALAGISWGGKLAVLAAAEWPDRVDALALICPGLEPRVGVTTSERIRITIAYFLAPRTTFPVPLADPSLFTGDPGRQAFIASDPKGLRMATAGLLGASAILDGRVRRALPRVRRPALLMIAGRDRIIDNRRTLAAFARLGSADATVVDYPEGHHTLEFDPDPDRYASDLVAWLDRVGREARERAKGA